MESEKHCKWSEDSVSDIESFSEVDMIPLMQKRITYKKYFEGLTKEKLNKIDNRGKVELPTCVINGKSIKIDEPIEINLEGKSSAGNYDQIAGRGKRGAWGKIAISMINQSNYDKDQLANVIEQQRKDLLEAEETLQKESYIHPSKIRQCGFTGYWMNKVKLAVFNYETKMMEIMGA